MTEQFINALKSKTKIRLTFYSKQDDMAVTRLCAPMDYGPGKNTKKRDNRYHLWDYESQSSRPFHTLSLLPEQILEMEFTDLPFNPSEFVTWDTNWIIQRDWGDFS